MSLAARVLFSMLALALAATADARPLRNIGGGAQLTYELASMHDIAHDASARPRPRDVVLGIARLHGFVGGASLAYHVGLDLGAGTTIRDAGFAYDVAVFPIGVALRFAATSFVAVGAGIGANGAVGTLDDATTLPLELRFELGRGVRLIGRARVIHVSNAPSREDGGILIGVGDELEAMLALRLGRGYSDFGFPTGNGYFVGAVAREALGARFAGVVVGYSIDMGTRRRRGR
jgi:hypothetical protein